MNAELVLIARNRLGSIGFIKNRNIFLAIIYNISIFIRQ
eukprot:UN02432